MPANPLTQEQLDDAFRLKSRFIAWQKRQREAGLPSSQDAASELLGVNQSALNQYLNGRIPLNLPFLLTISRVIEADPVAISPRLMSSLQGVPNKVIEVSSEHAEQAYGRYGLAPGTYRNVIAVDDDDPRITVIPKVKLRLTAGITGFEVEAELGDDSTSTVPTHWMRARGFKKEHLISIDVRGESMEPTFFAGDTAVLNTADKEPADGGVFAINYEGEPVVKRMVRDAGQWWLASDNADQRRFPRKLCEGERCIVIGRVVWKTSERF